MARRRIVSLLPSATEIAFAGWTEGMLEARAALIAENVARTARGEPPLNLIEASR
jgi:hypothetical protein